MKPSHTHWVLVSLTKLSNLAPLRKTLPILVLLEFTQVERALLLWSTWQFSLASFPHAFFFVPIVNHLYLFVWNKTARPFCKIYFRLLPKGFTCIVFFLKEFGNLKGLECIWTCESLWYFCCGMPWTDDWLIEPTIRVYLKILSI